MAFDGVSKGSSHNRFVEQHELTVMVLKKFRSLQKARYELSLIIVFKSLSLNIDLLKLPS